MDQEDSNSLVGVGQGEVNGRRWTFLDDRNLTQTLQVSYRTQLKTEDFPQKIFSDDGAAVGVEVEIGTQTLC